jgi:glucose 1-dehydrogenase
MNEILENVIKDLNLHYDYFIQTHTTNPLLSTKTLDNCIQQYISNKNDYDSLFSVKKHQTRLYTKRSSIITALNHNPDELLPTQNLEPLYEENSCIYIFTKETLFKKHHRIGYKPYMYVMDDIESSDIDTETDFLIAKAIHLYSIIDKSRIVLITGSNGDIGRAIAKKFKLHDWTVYGVDKDKCLDSTYIDVFFHKDVTENNAIKDIIEEIEQKEDKLDCIINNAALQICKPIWKITDEEWDATYNCNVKSIFLFSKYGINLLKKSANPNIINIGSVHATNTSDEISTYASSKAAIVGLTKNLAIELGKFNIRVNCLSPGAINTKMLRNGLNRNHAGSGTIEERLSTLSKGHILGKIGTPENVSEFAYYIINNNFITGSNLIMDGGATIKLSTE